MKNKELITLSHNFEIHEKKILKKHINYKKNDPQILK